MTKTPALNKKQLKAIALIADGMSHNAAAKLLGCNRVTIGRWAKQEPFASELEAEKQRRREREKQHWQQAANEQIDSSIDAFQAELADYHEATINAQKQRLAKARMLIDKGARRLADLPDEALSAADAIRLLDCADRMIERGLTDWGNAIAIEDVLKRLSAGS